MYIPTQVESELRVNGHIALANYVHEKNIEIAQLWEARRLMLVEYNKLESLVHELIDLNDHQEMAEAFNALLNLIVGELPKI